jgi:hypothetical protein
MFAILHAMGLARGTIKRRCTTNLKTRRVTVLCGSLTVVEWVNSHRDYGPENLQNVTSTNDRSMIKRVLTGIRELSRRGVDVTIAEYGQESSSKETMKVKTMARQKGRKACRSHCLIQPNAASATEKAKAAQQGASRGLYDGANMTSHTARIPTPFPDAQGMNSQHVESS